MFFGLLGDGTAGLAAAAQGVLAEGFGPEAVAVAVSDLTGKTDVAAAGDFLPDGSEVGAEFRVAGDPQLLIFKSGAETISQLFFDRIGDRDFLDFVAKAP